MEKKPLFKSRKKSKKPKLSFVLDAENLLVTDSVAKILFNKY